MGGGTGVARATPRFRNLLYKIFENCAYATESGGHQDFESVSAQSIQNLDTYIPFYSFFKTCNLMDSYVLQLLYLYVPRNDVSIHNVTKKWITLL